MKNPPKTLTFLESEQLIEQLARHTRSPASIRAAARNKLIGLLMLDAGLRVGELSKLRFTHLLYAGLPVVNLILNKEITKRNHERTIPLTPKTQAAISIFYEVAFCQSSIDRPLWAFVGRKQDNHITTRQLERIISNASLAAYGRCTNPHTLRHTFASRLMRITNIRVVQELLGHKNLQTTQIYTHPNSDDLSQAINGLSNGQKQNPKISL